MNIEKSKKYKILIVHNFYQVGGGEHTVYENERKLLMQNGHEVVSYTRSNFEINSLKEKIMLPINTIFNIKTYRDIKKVIKENEIDIVHCHNTFPLISPSVYYAAKSIGVPVIQTIHNFRFVCPAGILYRNNEICEECCNKNLYQSIKNNCYRNSKLGSLIVALMLTIHRLLGTYKNKVDKYIVLTQFNKNKLSSVIDKEKMVIKPNFTFIEDNKNYVNKEKDYFVFVGRFTEEKGIRFLLDSWKRIDNEKLIIIGDGPLKNEVEAVSKEHENIEYLGFLDKNMVRDKMSKAKALVFTGECYEGAFPLVLIEAMSAGTAILVPNIGNVNDEVRNSNFGFIYNFRDQDDFIRNVQKLSDYECYNQIGKNAKQHFNSKYTSDNNYKLLVDIYKEVRGIE